MRIKGIIESFKNLMESLLAYCLEIILKVLYIISAIKSQYLPTAVETEIPYCIFWNWKAKLSQYYRLTLVFSWPPVKSQYWSAKCYFQYRFSLCQPMVTMVSMILLLPRRWWNAVQWRSWGWHKHLLLPVTASLLCQSRDRTVISILVAG